MKHILFTLLLTLTAVSPLFAQSETSDTESIKIFDNVVFYDGYNGNIFDKDLDDGILRLSNHVYSRRLDPEMLRNIGDDLTIDVTVGALCDNFDRIGTLCLALVPKDAEAYEYNDVQRIEIARLITPFMNKNARPKNVPYRYEAYALGAIARDAELAERYDLWLEFDLFGVPYAANTQVRGCDGRSDVFSASVDFSFTPADKSENLAGKNVLVPIYTRRSEEHGNVNLNNYKEVATDTIGTTSRTFEFEVPKDLSDAKISLIVSSHGAGANGEEYARRLHLLYFDGELVAAFTPGGKSCEPYRKYNTFLNSIYFTSEQPDEYWERLNWCPGAAIPTRDFSVGAVTAGKHSVMLRVPDAEFYNQDGDIRPSLYFQGLEAGMLPAGIEEVAQNSSWVSPSENVWRLDSEEAIMETAVYSFDGRPMLCYPEARNLDLNVLLPGNYILVAKAASGNVIFKKVNVK